ncbi:peptidoglycan DD-metalloendopeptidase family protein [Paracoccaceae bacterium GXU_MW_L88]
MSKPFPQITMSRGMTSRSIITRAAPVALILGLAACQPGQQLQMPQLQLPQITDPAPVRPAQARTPDSRGVVSYPERDVMVARSGDSIRSMAARVGMSEAEVAQYNALPMNYSPRVGEIIALPRRAPSLQPVTAPPSNLPAPAPEQSMEDQAQDAINDSPTAPVRHTVQPGDTVYSLSRRYNVSAASISSANNLGSDMAIRVGQNLTIPGANSRPGDGTAVTPPPSQSEPLPQDIEQADVPASPNLEQSSASGKMSAPVSGSPTGGGSAGWNYAVPAGTGVKAADGGEVVLVSNSLGANGTIVLVRHSDNLLTVYARVSDVSVAKGDKVSKGQTIAKVAPSETPSLHFEVREGTQSVDPAGYF